MITTSADYNQLWAVLWGEIRNWVNTWAGPVPLVSTDGGPLVVHDLLLRKVNPETGVRCGTSYVMGRVSDKVEGLLGHHVPDVGDGIPRTLLVGDEASGLSDQVKEAADTWARRQLYIGNPLPCTNFFKTAAKAGDIPRPPRR